MLTVGAMAMRGGATARASWAIVMLVVIVVVAAVAVTAWIRRQRNAPTVERPRSDAPTIADEVSSWLRGRTGAPTPSGASSVDPLYFRERERNRLIVAVVATAAAIALIFEAMTCFCSHTVPGAVFGALVAGIAWRSARYWHRIRVASEHVDQKPLRPMSPNR